MVKFLHQNSHQFPYDGHKRWKLTTLKYFGRFVHMRISIKTKYSFQNNKCGIKELNFHLKRLA